MSETVIEQKEIVSPFDDSAWREEPIVPKQGNENTPTAQGNETISVAADVTAQPKETVDKNEDNTAVDYNVFIKEQFGFDSVEVAKEQINKWKEMKPSQEITFANDESKKLAEAILAGKKNEVLDILSKQQSIEKLTSAEINDKIAGDIVKLAMQQKYPTLTQQQIDYKFNKQFAIPEKPIQQLDELDGEYNLRLSNWERLSEEVKTELLIEAQIAKPELEKLKTELSFPDIFGNKEQKQPQLTQEEIAEMKAVADSQIKDVSNFLKNFNEVGVTVKQDGIEIPVNYSLSSDEKNELQSVLAKAIENNDVNFIFSSRWYDSDGKLKTDVAIKDLNRIFNGDKIESKYANEAAAKRLEAKIKADLNLNLGKQPQGTFNPDNSNIQQRQFDAIWDA